ncbi:MAG: DUF4352 domain-containing protein [Acidobacteria bacterium]|nr:DUF4352 domain-containing protein [Acidobacteriota bacterium]
MSTYRMGERATVGPLIYNVLDAQWLTELGSGVSPRVPANRFFVVRLSVVNSGQAESVVPPVSIEDENARSYTELMDGNSVPQWLGYLRRVKPAENLVGNIVFDVPPHEYKLRLQDEVGANQALVEVPLSFRPDIPQIVKTPEFQVKQGSPKAEDLKK